MVLINIGICENIFIKVMVYGNAPINLKKIYL